MLCLLCGKFYRNEAFFLSSSFADFSLINNLALKAEDVSVSTENQIINPYFFFQLYSEKDEQAKKEWRIYHKMFPKDTFSYFCEKTVETPELLRSLELIINAGSISDPVQKGALYSVALETVTTIIQSKNEKAFKPIADSGISRNLIKTLKAELQKIKSVIPEKGYNILTSKIQNLN